MENYLTKSETHLTRPSAVHSCLFNLRLTVQQLGLTKTLSEKCQMIFKTVNHDKSNLLNRERSHLLASIAMIDGLLAYNFTLVLYLV